jgi:hypothetical protein
MSIDDSTAIQSGGTTRRIDPDRFARAITEGLTATPTADHQYDVVHDDETYVVDVAAGHCGCDDHRYRGDSVVCKHQCAAAVRHCYRDVRNTELVARVLAHARTSGCPHGYAGCPGPTGPGLPCEDCIRSVGAGHWVVWCRVTNHDDWLATDSNATVDRGDGIATDGGRHTLPQSTCDHETTGIDYIERSDGQHKVIVCATCNLILEDCGVPEPDVCTDGGTVTLHPCSTCDGQAEGDDEQCPECQRQGVSDVDETPL